LTESELEDSTVYRISFIKPDNCDGIVESFECDLKNNNLFLFIPGSSAFLEHKNDKQIEKKYGVYFYHDNNLSNSKCLIEYNKMVFNYLVKNYDEKWINIIREYLYGFKEWRKLHLLENNDG